MLAPIVSTFVIFFLRLVGVAAMFGPCSPGELALLDTSMLRLGRSEYGAALWRMARGGDIVMFDRMPAMDARFKVLRSHGLFPGFAMRVRAR